MAASRTGTKGAESGSCSAADEGPSLVATKGGYLRTTVTQMADRLGGEPQADSSRPTSPERWVESSSDWISQSATELDGSIDEVKEPSPAPAAAHTAPKKLSRSERKAKEKAQRAAAEAAKRKQVQARGGVLTAVPQAALSRKEWKKLPRAQRVPYWRGRVLPKSILGICMIILSFALGAAASGTYLFTKYQYRQDQADKLISGFNDRTKNALAAIDAQATNARASIQEELAPIRKLAATGQTLENILTASQPSVWSVQTFDTDGAPVIGSAFVIAADAEKSFLLTSYNVVKAATIRPGPDITVRKGKEEKKATLWTWQEERDLALLIIDVPTLPRLDWAPASEVRLGTQVFAVSGLGTAGGAITQGFVADVSTLGLQHSAPTGRSFEGGPILNDQGKVVAVASRSYAPLGIASDGVYFVPPIASACQKVLKCPDGPEGQVTGAGAQR